MRSAALAVGLLVVLASWLARAREPYPYVDGEQPLGSGYHAVTESQEVLAEGELHATVLSGTLRPQRGHTPLEVVLRNAGSMPRSVRLSLRGHASYREGLLTSRSVEVGPGQRLSTFLLVSADYPSGLLTLESPGVESRRVSVYTEGGSRSAVLVLGTVGAFEGATAIPREERGTPRFSARFLSAKDAPRELAAYVGYDAVVLLEDVATVPADVWATLEAYAATGGYLVLPRPPSGVRARLPLLPSYSGELAPYGFGRVRMCGGSPEACGTVLQADLLSVKPVVWPRGPMFLGATGANGEKPLLDNAQAPLGRFLSLIFLFTLVVGPGGLVLARRGGPVALLVAVPTVAFVTCAAIILDSVLVDGFGVHVSRYSYTWLDRDRDRAVMVGLGAWYANFPPRRVRFPSSSALVAPANEREWGAEEDWTNGLTMEAGFLHSRTYREWGEMAVVPSRARLVVRREGDTVRVQNALGAPLDMGLLWLGGRAYHLPALADGAEGAATLAEPRPDARALEAIFQLPGSAEFRFGFLKEVLLESLGEGVFLAKVGGLGFAPTATALEQELREGVHLVRGRVDGP